MTANIGTLLTLDRLVHEPARLAILSILSEVDEAEFKFLEVATKLTKGNLSSHAQKLEEAGYIEIHKAFIGKLPSTRFRVTAAGRAAVRRYLRDYEKFQRSIG